MFARFNIRLVIGWLLFYGLVLFSGYGLAANAETVFQDGANWLKLAPIEPGAQPNSEAVDLRQEQVIQALGGISVRLDASRFRGLFSRRKQDPMPLFSQAALDQLARPLTETINRAGPHRDLLLQVSQNRREGAGLSGLIKNSRITTARIFHHDEHLHLILGAVEQNPNTNDSKNLNNNPKAGGYAQFKDQVEVPTGRRARESKLAAELSSDLALGPAPQSRSDWLALDLSGLATKAPAKPLQDRQAQPKAGAAKTSPPRRTDPEALKAIDTQTLDQLSELRELKRRDLITDELYETLVRELLDRDQNE